MVSREMLRRKIAACEAKGDTDGAVRPPQQAQQSSDCCADRHRAAASVRAAAPQHCSARTHPR